MIHPPITAPIMPITIFSRTPCWASVFIIIDATQPTNPPNIIQRMMFIDFIIKFIYARYLSYGAVFGDVSVVLRLGTVMLMLVSFGLLFWMAGRPYIKNATTAAMTNT